MATSAERKQRQRERMETAIREQAPEEWTEAICLRVLSDPQWKGAAMGEAAWRQLGKLQGYL